MLKTRNSPDPENPRVSVQIALAQVTEIMNRHKKQASVKAAHAQLDEFLHSPDLPEPPKTNSAK